MALGDRDGLSALRQCAQLARCCALASAFGFEVNGNQLQMPKDDLHLEHECECSTHVADAVTVQRDGVADRFGGGIDVGQRCRGLAAQL